MKIATVISNLITFLSSLEWTSDSGTGTTKLQAVYPYRKWSGVTGFPYACIYEGDSTFENIDIMTIQETTPITIAVCVNYDIINKDTEDEKRAEAELRVREAFDYIKTQLFKLTVEDTLGFLMQTPPSAGEEFDEKNHLCKRVITMYPVDTIDI